MSEIITRRGFLNGIFTLSVAPAIVKAESLMKIFVPPEKTILVGRGMTESLFYVDETPFPKGLEWDEREFVEETISQHGLDVEAFVKANLKMFIVEASSGLIVNKDLVHFL